ncbi:P-loop containing nucleoside triphosphate hydrolase protein, partial [Mycena filopes]
LPSEPKIFHGRESELSNILQLFRQGSPRTAILGAGGMGKTSLAKALLHHPEIAAKYLQHRYFVPCDFATTEEELSMVLGEYVGPRKSLTATIVQQLSNGPDSLLILDNLETAWEPTGSRKGVEELLSVLAGIPHLALIITMRGAEHPAKVKWTRPFLGQLEPLKHDAAWKTFIDIADDRHEPHEVEKILALSNHMPLVLTLLSHLVDMEDCATVLQRWEAEKTALLSEGYTKRTNLEMSISISLSSPRMRAMPESQDLLGLLSILPDGLSDVDLKQCGLPIDDVLGCKTTLLRTSLVYADEHARINCLVPIREYMQTNFPPTNVMTRPLLEYFQSLLRSLSRKAGKSSGAEVLSRIASNHNNMYHMLRDCL